MARVDGVATFELRGHGALGIVEKALRICSEDSRATAHTALAAEGVADTGPSENAGMRGAQQSQGLCRTETHRVLVRYCRNAGFDAPRSAAGPWHLQVQ